MQKHIEMAEKILLSPASLQWDQLESVLFSVCGQSVDYADLYLQYSQSESWYLEESLVKEGTFSLDQGFGLRILSGETTGFAFSDELSFPALQEAARSLHQVAGTYAAGRIPAKGRIFQRKEPLYAENHPSLHFTDLEKIDLLRSIDEQARKMDPRVQEVLVHLSSDYEVVAVLNQEGHLAADVRPLVHLSVKVIAQANGRRESGSGGGGGRTDYRYFTPACVEQYTQKAVRQALLNLESRPVAAGPMTVVLGPGWPAVLLHEAVGHGLEGDFNRKGSSAFCNRMGERVASPLCTIVDDGTLPDRRGSLSVDDEGTLTQCTVLIEQGVLKNYLFDRHNAQLMNTLSTGNGRRESYAHPPLPRMTNTYMQAGSTDPAAILESLDNGIYAVDFSGGQVDITSGKFVFSMSEAYWVEKGKIQFPVKGATLIGDGPEILHQVTLVGSDFALDTGMGHCGKEGQSVPVGVGQPTLRIESVTVGGTHAASA